MFHQLHNQFTTVSGLNKTHGISPVRKPHSRHPKAHSRALWAGDTFAKRMTLARPTWLRGSISHHRTS